MENTDLFFCCNCKYWTQFERRDVQTRLGWCNKDRQRVSISAKQDFCSSFAFNNPAPPTVADAERLSDHQLGELCRLLRDRLNFQEAINRLSEGCAFYSRKIDEQETTIARLTIERDRAREVAERQAAEISIQSDQLLKMSEHLNESFKQRDEARAALAAMDQTIKFLKLDLDNVRVIRENELLHHAREMEKLDMKLLTLVREKDSCEQKNRKLQSQLDAACR